MALKSLYRTAVSALVPGNCGYHDWVEGGDGVPKKVSLRVERGGGKRRVKRKVPYECSREGCYATKMEWETVGRDKHESYVINKKLRRFIE